MYERKLKNKNTFTMASKKNNNNEGRIKRRRRKKKRGGREGKGGGESEGKNDNNNNKELITYKNAAVIYGWKLICAFVLLFDIWKENKKKKKKIGRNSYNFL